MKKFLVSAILVLSASTASAGVINTDFDDATGMTLLGDAVVSGGKGQITQDIGSQRGGILFDSIDAGNAVQSFNASFDFVFTTSDGNGADGISFGLQNSSTLFNVFSFLGEEGSNSGLSIGFDTFDNGGFDVSDNSVSVNYNGNILSQFDLNSTGFVLDQGSLFNVNIDFSNGLLDVMLNGLSIFDDLAITGWNAFDGNFYFAGRTGGFASLHEVDNLRLTSVTNQVSEPTTALILVLSMCGLFAGRKIK